MILPIVRYPEPVLRAKCRPITAVTPEVQKLASDMLETMKEANGVGLAAPAGEGTRFGLQQVRERLATLYGERASLTLEDASDAEGGTRATVRLPLAPPPAPEPGQNPG